MVRLKVDGASGTVHVGRPAWLHCTVQGRKSTPVVWKKVGSLELPDNAVVRYTSWLNKRFIFLKDKENHGE